MEKSNARAWLVIASLAMIIVGSSGALVYTRGWKAGLLGGVIMALVFLILMGVLALLFGEKQNPEAAPQPARLPVPIPKEKKVNEKDNKSRTGHWRWVVYPCAILLVFLAGWWVGLAIAIIHLLFLLALIELGAKWHQAEPKSFRRDLLLAAFIFVLMAWAVPAGISLGRLNAEDQNGKQSEKSQRSNPLLSGEETR